MHLQNARKSRVGLKQHVHVMLSRSNRFPEVFLHCHFKRRQPGHMFAFKVLSTKCTQTETLLTQFTLKYACGSLLLYNLYRKFWSATGKEASINFIPKNNAIWPTNKNNNNTPYNNELLVKQNYLDRYCSPSNCTEKPNVTTYPPSWKSIFGYDIRYWQLI
uniref:Uncharacterized protein n=1 Tax=Glossina palpalis gambiensis TaxID=67801 RepID=A0A1B0BDD0_9MUSC